MHYLLLYSLILFINIDIRGNGKPHQVYYHAPDRSGYSTFE